MDPAQLQPGHRLDRYELLCPLAYGGMASVWLARFGGRKGFERLVVVKMILPQYSQDPRFQEMFLDEARIASRIEHANVARILDVGEQDESTFIVMEWVDGDSLSKIVRATEQKKLRIPSGIALRICADAAAGLHAAHVLKERDGTSLGVVHRDVSPQNILISNAGTTVLIDFGVAKARDRVSQETSAGQLKGKIRYMAPEQALGRVIDHRADVWALGTILYELFAGVPPYDGPNEVATLHMLTSGVMPAPLPSHVPAPIRAVVERALAYDPEARHATAQDLSLALEACMIEIGEPTSVSVVAQYTAQLLADRKAARKRAVDTALTAAHARDAERASSLPMPTAAPGMHLPPAPSSQQGFAPYSTTSLPPQPPSGADLASLPSSATSPSGGPLGEVPSGASSATLGSAAMEYASAPNELADDPARRRRFIAAAVLGVSVAAGVVGAVLIVSTALLKHDADKNPGSAGTAMTAVQATAPPEAQEPPVASVAASAALAPTPAPSAPAAPAASAAASAASAAATAAPLPASTVVAPLATTAAPAPPPPPATPAHRPSPPPASPPKPPPKPVATSTKPDRGF